MLPELLCICVSLSLFMLLLVPLSCSLVSLPPVSSVTLFLNLLACLAAFITDGNNGLDFGLSILWLILFTPCSFLCWYRPIYYAFRLVRPLIKSTMTHTLTVPSGRRGTTVFTTRK